MDLRNLPVDDLILDPDLHLRDKLDDFTVERYVEVWERMPPVVVYEVEGRLLLADGFHRHAAAVMLKKPTIPAEVRAGRFEDALDFVAGVNLAHGLPLSRAERRRAVEVKMKLHHDWSDRRLAEELGVGRELVAKVRKQLVEGGQVPAGLTRVGSDGKTYPAALPRDPNEHLPTRPEPADEPPRVRDRSGIEPPWDEAESPMPAAPARIRNGPATHHPERVPADARVAAPAATPEAAPSIDEMLEMMARQVNEVLSWTNADGFNEAYRGAGANARGLFQTAALKLAARADQLRRG